MSAPELEYPHLVEELRLAGLPPSEELRERVRAIGAAPVRQRRSRRPLLLLAPAALIVIAGTLAVVANEPAQRGAAVTEVAAAEREGGTVFYKGSSGAPFTVRTAVTDAVASQSLSGAAVAPNRSRAQQYQADLLLHVEGLPALSRATASAMSLTRNMGGYLVSASQDSTADGHGRSSLVLRVPTHKVQGAIVRFSRLGTILEQQIQVEDVQNRLDALFRQAQDLRARIAKLEAQPESTERDTKLRILRGRLDELTGRSETTKRRASFARIGLTLTTEESAAITPVPAEPGRFERKLDRALDVLAQEAAIALYVLIVAAPFALLAALLWLAARAGRRRSREALLERS